MLPRFVIPALGLVCIAPTFLTAQSAPAPADVPQRLSAMSSIGPQQCVWKTGDYAAWAAPSYDDRGWQPYSKWKIDEHTPYIWVRCHISLAAFRSLDHPALQVHFHGASQVFVNGALAGSSGNVESAVYDMSNYYTVPIPKAALAPSATLALRIAFFEISQTTPAEILLGDQSALQDHHSAAALEGFLGYLPIALCFALIGVVGFMLLGLYVTDRSRLELLLLAIICWLLCLLRMSELCTNALVPISIRQFDFLYGSGQFLEIFEIWFMFRIAGKRVPWFYRVTIAISLFFVVNLYAGVVLPAGLNLSQSDFYNSVAGFVMIAAMACATAAFAAFWPWNRIPRNRRAIAFFCMAWGAADIIWFSSWELNIAGIVNEDQTAHAQKYILILRAATTFCSILALLTILFREQSRIAKERAALAGEMEAAREIQQYLIPDKLPPTPGFTIRSAYHPSREVGGDFFQVLPDARDGSTLIVVGDVAGKGLRAGMLAALIVGAIRTAFKFTNEPGRILALLNERLQGRGLVTCLAMRIDSNGNAELANAGQLPPYIDGKELAIDGALPLGALPDAAFTTKRFQLGEGQRLLLVSDGVVEAQNAAGELFGFERTAAISGETADQIAHAAKQFGQEDDITVLTVSFASVEVAHA